MPQNASTTGTTVPRPKEQMMVATTYEPETADVVLDGDGCCWRYSGTEDHAMGFRWESFDGASLKRSDPPQPLTLLVRNGRAVDGT